MKRTAVIIVLLILLILSAGTNTYLYLNNEEAMAQKELELVSMRDSMQRELMRMEDSLDAIVQSLQEENQLLANKVSELEGDNNPKVIAAYQQIRYLRRQLLQYKGGDINVNSSGKKVNLTGIRKQLADAKGKITTLTAQLDTIRYERDSILVGYEVVVNEKEAVEVENVELKERIAKGAIPQFGTLITSAYDKKGKLKNKASKIHKFKLSYDILENPMVTEIVEEEVTIRLIDPDGGVMSTNNRKLQDKSEVSTVREVVKFDGALQKVKINFPPSGTLKGKLKKGKYTTELWTRGLLRQKNTFILD